MVHILGDLGHQCVLNPFAHPCGQFATEGSGADPRQKYGSHFAADLKAA